jgi:translation initiation factor 3 subunit F
MESILKNTVVNPIVCKIHPVVLFNTLDHHIRQSIDQGRVIGALLGTTTPEGVMEVKSSFPVPHTEGEKVKQRGFLFDLTFFAFLSSFLLLFLKNPCIKVEINIPYYKNMLGLHHRVSPKEVVVGWYSTTMNLDDTCVVIHEFFSKEMLGGVPILLSVDSTMKNFQMAFQTYVTNNVVLGGKLLGSQFNSVSFDLHGSESDKVGGK